jgi:hypothetical protein
LVELLNREGNLGQSSDDWLAPDDNPGKEFGESMRIRLDHDSRRGRERQARGAEAARDFSGGVMRGLGARAGQAIWDFLAERLRDSQNKPSNSPRRCSRHPECEHRCGRYPSVARFVAVTLA